jgi:hypothetical protein
MGDTSNQLELSQWVRQRLQSPICVDGAALDYYHAVFGFSDLTSLTDLESGEAASFLDLLFYPDQQVRLQFEERWGDNAYSCAHAETLVEELLEEPITAVLKMDPDAAAVISLMVPDYAVRAFIERLRLSWQPPARLRDLLHRSLPPPQRVQVRARLRQRRFVWSDERLDLLELFLDRITTADHDFEPCLDFLLDVLSEFEPAQSPFDFLIAKKNAFFQALCRNESLERRLRKTTMETLMLQGTRVVLGNVEQWESGMRLVDRICTALYGRTRIFQRPMEVRGEVPGQGMEGFLPDFE